VGEAGGAYDGLAELRALGALRMPIVKTQQKPFSHRLSPFSTVFPAALIRDSFDESRVGPFSGALCTVKKR
jgi:hypothetical protein